MNYIEKIPRRSEKFIYERTDWEISQPGGSEKMRRKRIIRSRRRQRDHKRWNQILDRGPT